MIRRLLASATMAGALLVAGTAAADAVEEFYRGKQIKMILPTAPGGSTALYGQTLSEFMARHIPGRPTIVGEFRTGAGGTVAANYVYNAAPKDGTVIHMLLSSVILSQHMQPKSVKFETDKFSFIGRMADLPRALIAWHTAGIASLEDAKATQVALGASGRTSMTVVHPMLINEFVGTKFKIVTGYRGAGETYLALERGEIGATTVAWDGLVAERGDWLRDRKVKVLAFMGDRKMPELAGVPRFATLGRTAEEKAVLALTLLPGEMGQAVAAPPGLPADRLAALRKAFDDTMKDPAFLQFAKSRSMPVEPMTGEELRRFVEQGMKQPKAIVERTRKLAGFDEGVGAKQKKK